MKKLTLNIEQLQVDSYEPSTRNTSERGTVQANECSTYTNTTRPNEFSRLGTTCIAAC
ncbi:hypothetical protein [Longimicrobium sp.]|uniref:hypothetical protein n=1 Tax=Longimicrobium sp. TaxID=2029185 RepID=UPI003B3A4422